MAEEENKLEAVGPVPVEERRRVVAVVGRPNVGKSALFNRIANRRIAIVHDESGVTRDRLVRPVVWEDEAFDLIDTGGVNLQDVDTRSAISSGIVDQVRVALDDAATAILVVDVQTGLTPTDEEVARMVRKAGVPCHVAVNKCDLPQHEVGVAEFEKLGFPLFAVSAQHDRGFGDLMGAVVKTLPDTKEESVENPLRVAIVGRPNAGKSSYINRILRQPRVIVSDVPGTTRDTIEVPFSIGAGDHVRHYRLLDTAGMRHVHRIDNSVERFSLFRSEQAVKSAEVVVLVLDAEVGPTLQDKHIAAMINRENKSCVILVNKWDHALELVEETGVTQTQYEPELRKAMPFMNHCPVVFISAKEGFNVRKSIETIDTVAAQSRVKLPTGMLNRVIEEAADRITAPSRGRKHFKIFYATQTGVAPVRIRLFVNDAKMATTNYTNYLIKALREAFGLEGAPVVIQYRERVRPDLRERLDAIAGGADGEGELSPRARAAARPSTTRRAAADKPKLRGKPAQLAAIKRKAGASPHGGEKKKAKPAAAPRGMYPSRSSARKSNAKKIRTTRKPKR